MGNLFQQPAPGEHTLHFRGDTVTFTLQNETGKKGKAWLRSNIGRAHVRHTEIIMHAEQGLPPLSRDWHDHPMEAEGKDRFSITLPLLGVGRYEAKAYFIEENSEQIQWPDGGNTIMKVNQFLKQFGMMRKMMKSKGKMKKMMQQLGGEGGGFPGM